MAMYYLREFKGVEQCTSTELKSALVAARVPKAKTFNVSDVLGKASTRVSSDTKSPSGAHLWKLTGSGSDRVKVLIGLDDEAVDVEFKNDITSMQSLANAVSDDVVRSYLDEAILAYGVGALRAAVVFLWSGAIRLLQDRALSMGANNLNAALIKHDPKARKVSKIEDYSGVKDVIQLLGFRELGMIDKGEWQTLQEGLDLRNRCGHPTKYTPGKHKVSAFIEDVTGIAL